LAQWERLELIGVVLAGTAVQSSEKYTKLLEERGVPKYALSLKWYQRSVDVPLGLPFNIAFYALMLEVYARMTNMAPETLIGDLTDVHIYNDQLDGVYNQLSRSPKGCSPRLVFPNSNTCFEGNMTSFVNSINPEDFHIEGYECHPKIKFPLSN
jgi:thymidylate synthase